MWSRIKKSAHLIEVVLLVTSFVFNLYFFNENQNLSRRIYHLDEKNYNLTQEIHYLDERIHNLTETIYEIEHPKPEIRVLEIQPIEIGPPLDACIDGCTFAVKIEVSVFTRHDGEFIIPTGTHRLFLDWSNWTEYHYGFGGDVERDMNFTHKIEPLNAIIHIDFDFNMYYGFSYTSILQPPSIDIATLHFDLEFHDLQTSSVEYVQEHTTQVVWNSQTLMP